MAAEPPPDMSDLEREMWKYAIDKLGPDFEKWAVDFLFFRGLEWTPEQCAKIMKVRRSGS